MDNANYICINSGNYSGRDDKGKFIERYISCGDKVYLEFNFGFVTDNNLCNLKPHYINSNSPHIENIERFCKCVTNDGRIEIYLKQENILNSFRPIIHKHIATVVFKTVEGMNKWLIDKPVNSIKDIKIGDKAFLVMYIDNGDD